MATKRHCDRCDLVVPVDTTTASATTRSAYAIATEIERDIRATGGGE